LFWVISVFVSYYFFYVTYSRHAIEELGNKAAIAAISLKHEVNFSEDEKERLFSLDFPTLLNDSSNVSFEEKAREIMSVSDIKYIYVQMILPEEKIKYYVTEENADYYGASPGTPLNVIYYLDAVVNNQTRMEDTEGNWYVDEDRYTVLKNDLLEVYENKEMKIFINNDEWGSYLSSYIPILSEEGSVEGVICADLFLDRLFMFTKDNVYILGGLTAGNLILLLFVLYLINKKRQLDLRLEETLMVSSTDFLTKVMNRKRFMDILKVKYETAIKGNLKFSFVFLDIDYFKEYNDYYGHQAGDLVLYRIGRILRKITERFSGITGRYGGDEFTMAFLGVGEEEIQKVINEIFDSLEELKIKNEYLGEGKTQTISIGASVINFDNVLPIDELINKADEALYLSKNQGRNMAYLFDGNEMKKIKRF
jgi:diguanylate cyclase (GGDEF)-like protein